MAEKDEASAPLIKTKESPPIVGSGEYCGPGSGALAEYTLDNANVWAKSLYSRPNWIVLSHFINIGIALNFLATPVPYYLVMTLDADAATTNTYSALSYLPWCMKIFMGVLSDCYPISGLHRMPYLIGGWAVFIACNIYVYTQSSPSVGCLLMWGTFIPTMGALLADTVADAMIVEGSAYEDMATKGRMRTQGYLVRQIATVVGGIMGSVLYNSVADGGDWSWGLTIQQCFLLQGALPLVTLVPLVYYMKELPLAGEMQTVSEITQTCWDFIKVDAVWIPMFFLYAYNVLYISNPAWTNFLYEGLDFSDFEVGLLYTMGSILGAVGLWAYDRYFFDHEWPWLYIWTTLTNGAFSFSQLCLLYKWTFGIPKFWFATGDYAMQSAISYICFMPMVIMFLSLIPPGTEGTLYALITTWQNVAAEVGYDIGTLLECIWPVSNDALETGHWKNVITLTYITSFCQCAPVFFVYLTYKGVRVLPDNKAMTKQQQNMDNTSISGATVYFAVFFASIAASLLEALWVIWDPDAC